MAGRPSAWRALPDDVVARIGVPFAGRRRARDALGRPVDVPWVAGLRIEIFGRVMSCDAVVLPAGATPLLGQIVLEGLHLVVDASSGEVAVNPDSPDDPIYDRMSLVA